MQPVKAGNQHHTDPEEVDERAPQIAGFDYAGQIWPSNRDSVDR
jgi:hypothetical protein